MLRGDEPFSQAFTSSCASSGPTERRCPQLASRGSGVHHGSMAQEAAGQQHPKPLRPHFLPLRFLLLLPRADPWPPVYPASPAASPLLSPCFQIPQKGPHMARLRGSTDPWTITVAAGRGPSLHRLCNRGGCVAPGEEGCSEGKVRVFDSGGRGMEHHPWAECGALPACLILWPFTQPVMGKQPSAHVGLWLCASPSAHVSAFRPHRHPPSAPSPVRGPAGWAPMSHR